MYSKWFPASIIALVALTGCVFADFEIWIAQNTKFVTEDRIHYGTLWGATGPGTNCDSPKTGNFENYFNDVWHIGDGWSCDGCVLTSRPPDWQVERLEIADFGEGSYWFTTEALGHITLYPKDKGNLNGEFDLTWRESPDVENQNYRGVCQRNTDGNIITNCGSGKFYLVFTCYTDLQIKQA